MERDDKFQIIDISRLLCAFLVVFIHAFESHEGHELANMFYYCMTGQAVPFFFIVSGFFFGKKYKKNSDKTIYVKKCIINTIKLYLIWSILWLPSFIVTYINMYPDRRGTYIALLLIRRFFFAGQGVYWYLLALAISYLCISIAIEHHKEKILYLIAVVGFILGLIYDAQINYGILGSINNMFYLVFSWSNNFIMKGLPYVLIGFLCSRKQLSFNKWYIAILYVIITVLSIIIYGSVQNGHYMLHYPIQALLLFLFSIQPVTKEINVKYTNLCRELSSTIYYVHTIFIYFVIDIVWGVDYYVLFKWLMAVFLSVALYVLIKLIRNKHLGWLVGIKH